MVIMECQDKASHAGPASYGLTAQNATPAPSNRCLVIIPISHMNTCLDASILYSVWRGRKFLRKNVDKAIVTLYKMNSYQGRSQGATGANASWDSALPPAMTSYSPIWSHHRNFLATHTRFPATKCALLKCWGPNQDQPSQLGPRWSRPGPQSNNNQDPFGDYGPLEPLYGGAPWPHAPSRKILTTSMAPTDAFPFIRTTENTPWAAPTRKLSMNKMCGSVENQLAIWRDNGKTWDQTE